MKKGYLYLVVSNVGEGEPLSDYRRFYHFFSIGEIVECTNGKIGRFVNERFPQTLKPEHVKLIGKI